MTHSHTHTLTHTHIHTHIHTHFHTPFTQAALDQRQRILSSMGMVAAPAGPDGSAGATLLYTVLLNYSLLYYYTLLAGQIGRCA